MKKLRVQDAVGHVLCHDMTRIVKGEYKGPQFRKGHVIAEEDIPMLLSMGKEHIYVWELAQGLVHEDEGARFLAGLCNGGNMLESEIKEGKVELFASVDGLFRVNVEGLRAVNAVEGIAIATRRPNIPVKAGDKLAGMRVIPLVIEQSRLDEAKREAGQYPLLELLPYKKLSAGVIATGGEVKKGLIEDQFTPVVIAKLEAYGIDVIRTAMAGDDADEISANIAQMRENGSDVVLCLGGMSVDPDDATPGAIRQTGARVVTYGAPVLPGAMFMLGYYEDGGVVMGLPGCVMYAGTTVFDIVLPRVAAGIRMDKSDFAAMGAGGLCLGCGSCRYPECGFGC